MSAIADAQARAQARADAGRARKDAQRAADVEMAAWENAVRSRWYLSRTPPDAEEKDEEPDSTVRYLSRRKANYADLTQVRLTYLDGILKPDADGATDSNLIRNLTSEKTRKVVMNAVSKLKEMNLYGSEKAQATNFLPKLIKQYNLSQGIHRAELERSMRQLMVDNVLVVGPVGRYSNGTVRPGIVTR